MRGRPHYFPIDEVTELGKQMGVKALSEHYGVSITTMTSFIQKNNIPVVKVRKPRIEIPLTEENIAYIKEHNITENANHFGYDMHQMTSFICRNKLEYNTHPKRATRYKIEDIEKRKHIIGELLKIYTITEIAELLHTSKSRVSQLFREGF